MAGIQNAIDNLSFGLTTGVYSVAGQKGNILKTVITFSGAVSLPNATPTSILSTGLPAGNFILSANCFVLNSGGSITFKTGYFSNTVAGTVSDQSQQHIESLASGSWNQAPIQVSPYPLSLASASTQTLMVQANFTGTCTICGYMMILTI